MNAGNKNAGFISCNGEATSDTGREEEKEKEKAN
jgi:hypothetical protein